MCIFQHGPLKAPVSLNTPSTRSWSLNIIFQYKEPGFPGETSSDPEFSQQEAEYNGLLCIPQKFMYWKFTSSRQLCWEVGPGGICRDHEGAAFTEALLSFSCEFLCSWACIYYQECRLWQGKAALCPLCSCHALEFPSLQNVSQTKRIFLINYSVGYSVAGSQHQKTDEDTEFAKDL